MQGGYTRYLKAWNHLQPGLGASFSAGVVPERLQPVYGSRVNLGFGVFLTLRPAAMMMAHSDTGAQTSPANITTPSARPTGGAQQPAGQKMVMVQTAYDPAKLSCLPKIDPKDAAKTTYQAATPALAVGHAIGRIGCFMVGDDYGRPSNLPWAVAFPEGLPPTSVPVHPTQLYEAIALAGVAWALVRWRRAGVADALVLGRYLVLAGSIRFAIEFIRVNVRVLGALTLAHLIALSLIVSGVVILRTSRSP